MKNIKFNLFAILLGFALFAVSNGINSMERDSIESRGSEESRGSNEFPVTQTPRSSYSEEWKNLRRPWAKKWKQTTNKHGSVDFGYETSKTEGDEPSKNPVLKPAKMLLEKSDLFGSQDNLQEFIEKMTALEIEEEIQKSESEFNKEIAEEEAGIESLGSYKKLQIISSFYDAIENNNLIEVSRIINELPSLNIHDTEMQTPLNKAFLNLIKQVQKKDAQSIKNAKEILDELLFKKSPQGLTSLRGSAPLEELTKIEKQIKKIPALKQMYNELQGILDQQIYSTIDIDVMNPEQVNRALFIAIENNNEDKFAKLFQKCQDYNVKNFERESLLEFARKNYQENKSKEIAARIYVAVLSVHGCFMQELFATIEANDSVNFMRLFKYCNNDLINLQDKETGDTLLIKSIKNLVKHNNDDNSSKIFNAILVNKEGNPNTYLQFLTKNKNGKSAYDYIPENRPIYKAWLDDAKDKSRKVAQLK